MVDCESRILPNTQLMGVLLGPSLLGDYLAVPLKMHTFGLSLLLRIYATDKHMQNTCA